MLSEDKWLTDHCAFDSFLQQFAKKIIDEGLAKLKEGGENLDLIHKTTLKKPL
jgi:hypothetical protein